MTSFVLTPDNLIYCHYFVGHSYLTVGRDEEEMENTGDVAGDAA